MSPETSSLSTTDAIRERALGFVSGPVSRGDLALAFAESRASSVDVHVEGRNFYPPDPRGHRRSHVLGPHQPVRVPARCRRRRLRRRAGREGGHGCAGPPHRRPARLRPRAQLARSLRPAHGRGHPGLRRPGDEAACPGRTVGRRRRAPLEPGRARPHRPPQGRGRRRSNRVDRRSRHRGPLPGRPLPRPVPPRHRPSSGAAAARVRRQLPVARRRDPFGRSRDAVPGARCCRTGCRSGRRASRRARPVPADHRRDRAPARERRGDARRRQPVRDRPADDPPRRAGRAPWRPRPPRSGETEQLGVRGSSSDSTTRACSTPESVSSSTPRCCTRRRSCATARSCSRARATSRPGA